MLSTVAQFAAGGKGVGSPLGREWWTRALLEADGSEWEGIVSNEREEFSRDVKQKALLRQRQVCASCGFPIVGMAVPAFGENVHFHHVIPTMGMRGPATVENCVALCRSCHYSAHAGGRTADTSMYADIARLPMPQKIKAIAKLYPHYNG
jgi:5-methylcytosine-specific restriction endonuclease McrA